MVKKFHSERQELAKTSLEELSNFHSSLFSVSVSFVLCIARLLISCVGFLEGLSKSVIIRFLIAFTLPFALGFVLIVFLLCGILLMVIRFCSLGMDLVKR